MKKLVIGDGAIGSFAGYEEVPIVHVLETWPQIIGFDTTVLEYFKEQSVSFPSHLESSTLMACAQNPSLRIRPQPDLPADRALPLARGPAHDGDRPEQPVLHAAGQRLLQQHLLLERDRRLLARLAGGQGDDAQARYGAAHHPALARRR